MTCAVFWTDERVNELERLCGERLPYTEIGRLLGCSRNAAIGKAGRLGIDNGNHPGPRGFQWPDQMRARIRAARKPKTVAPPPSAPRSLCIPLFEIRHGCRFIANDPTAEATCCGHATYRDSSYCEFHWRLTHDLASIARDAKRAEAA